jgi:hypothetical protein
VSRFEKMGDLFAPVLELKQRLPDLRKTGAAPAVADKGIEIAAQAEEVPKPKRRSQKRG